jgi:hypothetical protein
VATTAIITIRCILKLVAVVASVRLMETEQFLLQFVKASDPSKDNHNPIDDISS